MGWIGYFLDSQDLTRPKILDFRFGKMRDGIEGILPGAAVGMRGAFKIEDGIDAGS